MVDIYTIHAVVTGIFLRETFFFGLIIRQMNLGHRMAIARVAITLPAI